MWPTVVVKTDLSRGVGAAHVTAAVSPLAGARKRDAAAAAMAAAVVTL